MGSLTKNKQDIETIQKMVNQFFAPRVLVHCQELTEGYFNVAYLLELDNGRQIILKIAPLETARIMTYEKNIIHSEVEAMRMVAKQGGIPVPEVLGYDDSCRVCRSPYFFMEKVKGHSLNSVKDTLTAEQLAEIYRETGAINRRIHEIICPCFGYPSQRAFQGKRWFEVFQNMLAGGIDDAIRGKVELGISVRYLMKYLEQDREYFEEVKIPRLVHWDCWEGNIFIHHNKITGIIDWERCIWGDPMLEVGFRTYADNRDFLQGYGIEVLTSGQERRALWYDIYALILMSLECEYRKYETVEMYDWASNLLLKQYNKMEALHMD